MLYLENPTTTSTVCANLSTIVSTHHCMSCKHKYWLHTPSLDPVGFIHHQAAVCTHPCVLYNMQDNYSLYTQIQSAHITCAGLQSGGENTTCTHNTNTVCRHKYYLNIQVQSAYTNTASPHSLLPPHTFPTPNWATPVLTHPFPCPNWPTSF